jgi:hypothetical protein
MMIEVLDEQELADYLLVKRRTIQRWRISGTLPAPSFWMRRRPYWTRDDMAAFLDACRVEAV